MSRAAALGWLAIATAVVHSLLTLASVSGPGFDEVSGLASLPRSIAIFHLTGVAIAGLLIAGGYAVLVQWRIGAWLCLVWSILFTGRAIARFIVEQSETSSAFGNPDVPISTLASLVFLLVSLIIPMTVALLSVHEIRRLAQDNRRRA